MSTVDKKSKIIHIDGSDWIIGGTWTAGGRYPKNPSFSKSAKEELFDPKKTSAIWLKDSEQVGWFCFDDKPLSAKALAPLVLSNLDLNGVPWHGIFKLEDGWWIVAVDDAMALHPLWDTWVSDKDFIDFYQENNAKWMTFSHGVQLDNFEETKNWLFANNEGKNAKKAVPINSSTEIAKKAGIIFFVFFVLFIAGMIGYHFWDLHERSIMEHKKMLMMDQERLKAEALENKLALNRFEILKEKHQIEETWKNWPKPWVAPMKWSVFFNTCEKASDTPMNDNGWTLNKVSCHWSPNDSDFMDISWQWVRGQGATVLDVPENHGSPLIQDKGNLIIEKQKINLKWNKKTLIKNFSIPSLSDDENYWLGISQKWNGIIDVKYGKPESFLAPIPSGTSPKVSKLLHPPVLWEYFPVNFKSIYAPKDFTFLSRKGIIPSDMSIFLGLNGHYTLTGVQYAQ